MVIKADVRIGQVTKNLQITEVWESREVALDLTTNCIEGLLGPFGPCGASFLHVKGYAMFGNLWLCWPFLEAMSGY